MKQFKMHAVIQFYDTFRAFAEELPLGGEDLLLASGSLNDAFIRPLAPKTPVLLTSAFGKGEPTADRVDAIRAELPAGIRRIVAVGGGSVLDIAKMLSVRVSSGKTEDLFLSGEAPRQVYEVVAVPATCGTGSEVTNTCAVELTSLHTKRGLSDDAMFPARAVLIPELLTGLPYHFFATSSIDALVHAAESFLSPRATPHSLLFSQEALRLLLQGYQYMMEQGLERWTEQAKMFLLASNYAGLAFSSAGCAAVHALSYPLGGGCHIPHGEANQLVFSATFQLYQKKEPRGVLNEFERLTAASLGCSESGALETLFTLLDRVLPRKPLREYGISAGEFPSFTESVLTEQQRLLCNSYVPLTAEDILSIYQSVY